MKVKAILEILNRNKTRTVLLAFFIVGIALYANSFKNEMFWDDHDGIVNNAYIKDWAYFPKFFSENLIAGSGLISNYWRPLLLTVFSIEWHLWGDSVAGYHIVNTLTHVGASFLLFLILRKLFRKRWLAFFTSLIFLIHPLQTEAVTYVSGLADPLSALITLLGCWFYLKFRDEGTQKSDSWNYMLALGMYPLALMTKDSAVIMPGIIALVDYFYNPNQALSLWERLKLTAKNTYPFFIITGIYAFLRATSLNFQNTFNLYDEANTYTTSFLVRLYTFFEIITVYFTLLFFPNNLHMERTVPLALTFFQPQVMLGALFSLGLISAAFWSIRRMPIFSFGIFWFFGVLFPHSNLLVPTAGLLYEHWLYLPMVGIWLIVFSFVLNLKMLADKRVRNMLLFVLAAYCLFFSYMTISRNREWRDPITFYNQTMEYAPESYRIVNNLGMAYADKGRWEESIQMYEKAIQLSPEGAVAYHNLGNTHLETGNSEEAIRNFNKAIEMDPSFFYSYNALTRHYLEQENYEEALKTQERYLEYSPSPLDTLFLLAQISLETDDKTKALEYLNQGLKLYPNHPDLLQAIRQLR